MVHRPAALQLVGKFLTLRIAHQRPSYRAVDLGEAYNAVRLQVVTQQLKWSDSAGLFYMLALFAGLGLIIALAERLLQVLS